jgi:hypothetical protein
MFQRVDAQHAGPSALGILVPQGTKTLVIVRPRALAWDLLPAKWNGDAAQPPQFCVFTRDEAAGVARRFMAFLESTSANPVQTFGSANSEHTQIWLRTDEFVWIVCRRAPGAAYQPMLFASPEAAVSDAEKIAAVVFPAASVKQEYYFNTQNFS